MTTKLRSTKRWLEKMELQPELITLNYPEGKREGLRVDTDYEGPYPNSDVFQIHSMTRNHIAKRYGKSLTVESRGYYTAMFIIEQ